MVRTTLGAQVETNVTVTGSESVEYLDFSQSGNVPDGSLEQTVVRASPGTIFEFINLDVTIPSPGGTSTDTHSLAVVTESPNVNVLFARSDGATPVGYRRNFISSGNDIQDPPTAAAQSLAIRGLRADENNGILLIYSNKSGATQTSDRTYKLSVRVIQVKE